MALQSQTLHFVNISRKILLVWRRPFVGTCSLMWEHRLKGKQTPLTRKQIFKISISISRKQFTKRILSGPIYLSKLMSKLVVSPRRSIYEFTLSQWY